VAAAVARVTTLGSDSKKENTMELNSENIAVILAAALAISEVIALTSLKSNSIFQLVVNVLKTLAGKDD